MDKSKVARFWPTLHIANVVSIHNKSGRAVFTPAMFLRDIHNFLQVS